MIFKVAWPIYQLRQKSLHTTLCDVLLSEEFNHYFGCCSKSNERCMYSRVPYNRYMFTHWPLWLRFLIGMRNHGIEYEHVWVTQAVVFSIFQCCTTMTCIYTMYLWLKITSEWIQAICSWDTQILVAFLYVISKKIGWTNRCTAKFYSLIITSDLFFGSRWHSQIARLVS